MLPTRVVHIDEARERFGDLHKPFITRGGFHHQFEFAELREVPLHGFHLGVGKSFPFEQFSTCIHDTHNRPEIGLKPVTGISPSRQVACRLGEL